MAYGHAGEGALGIALDSLHDIILGSGRGS